MPIEAQPPPVVFVSYCTRCGGPIVADVKPHDTRCPNCPITPRGGPKVQCLRYQRMVKTVARGHVTRGAAELHAQAKGRAK